ncbi:hypothetical protein [Haloarcula sebkhae]|uniref:Uncharacterized protein n=2 Tax=Haloarcula sebkhae TaxID=932660 RepID=A0ACC6VH01_9EURY|nr:hypothetical protein [Haloarcula sebkhae]GGK54376.1 hypothetical protein GCM10009067_03630 [Haloarcula sebkhae]
MTGNKTIFSAVAIVLLIMFAGCSGPVGGSGSGEEKTTPTQTAEPTQRATKTPTPVPTETESTPLATEEPETESRGEEELSRAEKFEAFDENLQDVYEAQADDRYVDSETNPDNNSYHLTVRMRDTTNRTKTVEDRLNPLWKYQAAVSEYNAENGNYEERDHTWIPDSVNVTFVTQDGEVFQTSHIKYLWAYKYYSDEWSLRVLMGKYSATLEEGPAYHDKWK